MTMENPLTNKQRMIISHLFVPNLSKGEQKRFARDLDIFLNDPNDRWMHDMIQKWGAPTISSALAYMADKVDDSISAMAHLIKKYEIQPPPDQIYAIMDNDHHTFCIHFNGSKSQWVDQDGELYDGDLIFEVFGDDYKPNITDSHTAQEALRYFVKEAAKENECEEHELETAFEAIPCEKQGNLLVVKMNVPSIQWQPVQEEEMRL